MRSRLIVKSLMLLLLLAIIPTMVTFAVPEKCTVAEANAVRSHHNRHLHYNSADYYAGSREVSGQLDAIVAVFSGNHLDWCWIYDEDDANTVANTLDQWNGRMFISISVDGPDSDLSKFTGGGWLSSYGVGGWSASRRCAGNRPQ